MWSTVIVNHFNPEFYGPNLAAWISFLAFKIVLHQMLPNNPPPKEGGKVKEKKKKIGENTAELRKYFGTLVVLLTNYTSIVFRCGLCYLHASAFGRKWSCL